MLGDIEVGFGKSWSIKTDRAWPAVVHAAPQVFEYLIKQNGMTAH